VGFAYTKYDYDNMADDTQIRKIAKEEIALDKQQAQYGVNRVPVHVHNGLDSPKLDFNTSIINRQVLVTSHVPGTSAATAGNYGHFFINPLYASSTNTAGKRVGPMSIITMTECHGRAGNDAGTVTVSVVLLASGDASLSGGTAIATFNLKSTADIPAFSTLKMGASPAVIYSGARLALQTSGTLTNVADVVVTVLLLNLHSLILCPHKPLGDLIYSYTEPQTG